jgi:predicted RNase H-like HicB family nuclease
VKESEAMLEIRKIRDENSLRRLSQTPEERAREKRESMDWFIKAIGKPVKFAGMHLHYSTTIEYDADDKIFVARIPELRGCMAHGATHEDAMAHVHEAMQIQLDTMEGAIMKATGYTHV